MGYEDANVEQWMIYSLLCFSSPCLEGLLSSSRWCCFSHRCFWSGAVRRGQSWITC